MKGLHSVRQLLYKLRQLGAPVEADGESVVLPDGLVDDDYSHLVAGDIPDDLLDRIAGGFLPGFTPEFSEAYTEWLERYRGDVTLRLRTRLVEHIGQLRSSGNWDRLARVAKACLALDPLNEEATLALAEVLALSGSKAEAVQLLDRYIAEVGPGPQELRIPATVLRRRIAERLPDPVYRSVPQPPMVGREREMQELSRYLLLAQSGHPQTVLVTGEAGIGKSRLVSEFAKVAELQGAVVRTVTLQPHDKRRPLGAFMDLIPQLRDLPGALGCAPDALQLLDHLTAVDPPSGATTWGAQANATRAIAELIDAVSSESALVLVLEDAHWADEMSVNTLLGLTFVMRQSRALFLVTSREQDLLSVPEWGSVASLTVSALTEEAARTVLNQLLDRDAYASDGELMDWLVRSGSGNPLFLVSLAGHFVATGERFVIPPSLADILRRRLDHLDTDAATVFDTCVLLGKHATIGRLHAVLQVPALQLAGVLRRLEDESLIIDIEGTVRSTHDLLSEIAISRAPAAALRLLHTRIALTLEHEIGVKDDSMLWSAAEHWAASGAPAAAVAILEHSANRALAVNQVQRASEFLKRAFDLVTNEGQKRALAVRLVHCASKAEDWLRVREAFQWLSDSGRAPGGGRVHDDLELIQYDTQYRLGEERPSLIAALWQCVRCLDAGPEHRMHAARRLLTLADETLDPAAADEIVCARNDIPQYEGAPLDQLHFDMLYEVLFGDRRRAAELADRMVAEFPFTLNEPKRIIAHNNGIIAAYRGGNVALAEARAIEQYDTATKSFAPGPAYWAASTIALMKIDRGDLSEGHRWTEMAEAASMGTRFAHLSSSQLSNRLRLAILEARVDDAKKYYRTFTAYPISRAGRSLLVAISDRMRIRQLEGRPPDDDDDLAVLLDTHEAACRVGLHDDVVATIWYALAERGRITEADAFLSRYLNRERRDRYPPAEEISQILRSERSISEQWKANNSQTVPAVRNTNELP